MARSLTTQSPTTSNTIPVVSNAGFNAGDLVYQKNGAVDVIPNGLVSTGNFNISNTSNIMNGPINSNVLSATGTTGLTGGFAYAGPNAAKLSNGNLVIVYNTYDGSSYLPYFRIVDENYTEVVAPTRIGNITANSNGTIAVCALPAGGFAVAVNSSVPDLYIGVYTNAGAVTTALAVDSSIVSPPSFTIAARSSGNGFVVVANDSAGNTKYKVYSDTGAQVIAATTVAAYSVGAYRPAVAVRSDNSFVVGVKTTTNVYRYYVYSSTGTAVTNGQINPTYNIIASSPHFQMTTITSGGNLDMVYIVFIEATSNYIIRQTLNASNTLGTETPIAVSYTASIQSLSSGGYAIACNNSSNGALDVYIFNSSDTQIAVPELAGIGIRYTSSATQYTSIVELASNIALVGSYGYQSSPSRMSVMAQIVKATNLVRNFTTNNLVVSSASSGVNAYARGSSTPNAAYFAASTTTTLSKTISSGAIAYLPAVNNNVAVNFIHNKVMQNGDIVVVYSTSTTVAFNVYTSSGTLISNTVVGTSFSTPIAKACVLSNGKLVIAVATSANITYYVYSTSYGLIQSATQTSINGSYTPNNPNSGGYGFDISAMVNSRFVVGFTSGTVSYYSVLTDTLTDVQTAGVSGTYAYGVGVSGMANGGFSLTARQTGGGATFVFWYTILTTTTYNNFQAVNIGSDATGPYWVTNATTAQGLGIFVVQSNTTAGVYAADSSYGAALSSQYGIRLGTGATVGMCTMPNGQVLSVYLDGPGAVYTAYLHNLNGSSNTTTQFVIGINGTGTAASTPYTCVSAMFDNLYVVSYLDTAGKGYTNIQSVASQTYTTGITAGVTIQNSAGYAPSQSNGYIFKGVATTSATAGGTGTVQNIGQAQLNSNYPAGTTYQAFDSTGTLVQGTKGTIVGRNVNMTGT